MRTEITLRELTNNEIRMVVAGVLHAADNIGRNGNYWGNSFIVVGNNNISANVEVLQYFCDEAGDRVRKEVQDHYYDTMETRAEYHREFNALISQEAIVFCQSKTFVYEPCSGASTASVRLEGNSVTFKFSGARGSLRQSGSASLFWPMCQIAESRKLRHKDFSVLDSQDAGRLPWETKEAWQSREFAEKAVRAAKVKAKVNAEWKKIKGSPFAVLAALA